MFGGGGHRNAAGFKLRDKDIAGVQKELLSELHVLLTTPQN
jgi:oligoribonuclease NrnB/cAMP/cGMP phosphodiesterase (DHH superfamily)